MRRGRRRPLALAALCLVLTGGGAAFLDAGLGTCEWLDRWLARSGCVAKARLDDFSPLAFRTMVPAGEGRMRLFGTRRGDREGERSAGAYPPDIAVQFVFDLATGRESERADLPLGAAPFTLERTAPREGEAVLACQRGTVLCEALRPQAFVLSARSGEVVGSFDTLAEAKAALAAPDIRNEEALLPGRGLIAAPDRIAGGIGLRTAGAPLSATTAVPASDEPARGSGAGGEGPDGGTRFVAPDPRALAVRASPDGGFVARIEATEGGGSRIRVFDVAERAEVATLSTDGRHPIRISAAWAADGRHLVALGGRGREDADGVDLYVFRLR